MTRYRTEQNLQKRCCIAKANCHTWALAEKVNNGGHIEYYVDGSAVATLYGDDLRGRTSDDPPSGVAGIAKVQEGDLLRYQSSVHSTLVLSVEKFAQNPDKYRPTALKWKSGCSGVYSYGNTEDTDRFATPGADICGGYDPNEDWEDQEWRWHLEGLEGPGCWTEN